MMTIEKNHINQHEIAAWVLMGLFMLFVLKFHLLPALLAGLLVYELVHIIAPYVENRILGIRAKMLALGVLVVIIVGLLTLAAAGMLAFFRSDAGSLTALLAKMAQILDDSRKVLPLWLQSYLPADALVLKAKLAEWLRSHSTDLQGFGAQASRALAHIIIGMVVGGMIALRDAAINDDFKPFAGAMAKRASLFSQAFGNVVFAQVRISAINAFFTGVYLAVILPLLGVQLPLVKTMIAITFVVGLIPVAGNLISNTIIVIVSLSQSIGVALGSLIYLVIIHKFEYFLNARIVGGQIRANAWELLIAMLCMEAAFGIGGVIAAPIYYAYIKSELRQRKLV